MTEVSLALVNGLGPKGSEDLFNDIAGRLRARGVEVELFRGLEKGATSSIFRRFDVLISNTVVPTSLRAYVPTYAGIYLSRPNHLRLLEESDIPTMEWALARTRRQIRQLFELWSADRLLLKPSFTYGGKGVRVFTRGAAWLIRWRPDLDVFCREVNPDDGDVYKAELFNGRILISWKSAAPPIRTLFRRGIHRGLRGAYGERSLWEPFSKLTEKLEALSRRLTAKGLSHVSVDLMRRADGEFLAIEINLSHVATWWTQQFPEFRDRYADALYELTIRYSLGAHTKIEISHSDTLF